MKLKPKHLFIALTVISFSIVILLRIIDKTLPLPEPFVRPFIETYLLFISLIFILTSITYYILDKLNKPTQLKFGLMHVVIYGLGIYFFYNLYEHIILTAHLKKQLDNVVYGFGTFIKLPDLVGLVFLFSGLVILAFKFFTIFNKKQTPANTLT